ncbi:growth-inhibiting protein 1, variant [Capsaspora owczarzaki ATCC 30864]|nr:growth-inhibiting protein 1, variant [Capsaspora owczarzaki ATCC 30864]
MTVEEMAKFVDGEPDAVNNVVTSLILRNVAYRMPAANNYVIVDKMPLAVASELFMCNFHLFESEKGNRIIKTLEYTLDSDIADAVDFVLGLDNFPSTSARKTVISSARRAATSDDAPLTVSPSSINIAYNLSNYMATNPATTQAVASFLSQYFTPSDLSTFQSRYSVPLNPIRQIVGGNDPSNPGMEATLDVEYITATGRNVTTWFVFESSLVNEGQEDFLKYLIGQLNTTNTPLVHSISYGDIADTIPEDYKARVSIEFQKFGVIGRTIAIAAGDNGVRCENNVFSPEWPTSDPNVLSIGGTIASGNTEHVWADGGGGFSNTFARPSYQSDAVAKYLSSGVAPATSFFNSSSRAYPDIAAFAMGFEVFFDGAPATVGGTSAATPTWAGILSLLNDVRLNKGLPSLGFFNPLLYQLATQHPEAFHDITVGSNPFGSCPGFQATTGWDPASGWGTPNFGVLAALLSTK